MIRRHTPPRPLRPRAAAALVAAALSLTGAVAPPALAAGPPAPTSGTPPSTERPDMLREIGIDQKLGDAIPLDLAFRDETGAEVRLRDYFGDRPVILTLNYYECPMLCSMVLNGLVGALKAVSFDAGKDFTILTVSINPRETPAQAAEAKGRYAGQYGRPGAERGWRFLTGDEASIHRLAEAVGFRYAWDAEQRQFAHAAGIMVLTPDGRLARYFYGVEFAPRDIRFGLVEASEGRIGTLTDAILLFCWHYDPKTGTYGAAAVASMQAGGAATVVALGTFLFFMWRRERRRARAGGRAAPGR